MGRLTGSQSVALSNCRTLGLNDLRYMADYDQLYGNKGSHKAIVGLRRNRCAAFICEEY